jgi:hypothetical protein
MVKGRHGEGVVRILDLIPFRFKNTAWLCSYSIVMKP